MTDAEVVGVETQAERVIRALGGAYKLSQVFDLVGKSRAPAVIYRWMHPKNKGGTGGLIPSSAMEDVLMAADFLGVELTPEMLDPRPVEKIA